MKRYRLSRDAERDLIEIARFITNEASLAMAERLLTDIIETIILIAAQPGIGRQGNRYGTGVRSLPKRSYKIYYRQRGAGIVVLHVFHTARDQPKAWTK